MAMEIMNCEVPAPVVVDSEGAELSYAYYSCVGGRSEQQDCLGVDIVGCRHVFTVCDGMGGHAGGRIASETAVRALLESLEAHLDTDPVEEAIATAVTAANDAVRKKATDEPQLRGMGTTLTLLIIDKDKAYTAYIGDSRIYQLREGKKYFRSFDQSMVFEQVKAGRLAEEEARVHPRANVLTKAIGIYPQIEAVIAHNDYKAGDRFILCCDGVWNSQPEPELIGRFLEHKSLKDTVESFVKNVEQIGKEEGGHHDNHTMIVIDVNKNPLLPVLRKKSWLERLKEFFSNLF